MGVRESELKRLTLDDLHLIYSQHLKYDFPPEERKPLSAMEKLYAAGRYDLWGLYRAEELQAYALLWRDPEGNFALLDYLGVCQGQPRGKGLGTAMVQGLLKAYGAFGGILVEAGAEDADLPPEEAETRRRRLEFYCRLGFRRLSYTARIFGVRYAMLLSGGRSEEEAMEAHERLYHYELTPWLYDRSIQIPERD